MTRRRRQLITTVTAALVGVCAAPAFPQQQQQGQDRSSRPAQPRPAAPIPQDSRVPLPRDSRAPIGSSRLPDFPSAAERARSGAVDPPREPRERQPKEPQDPQGAIEEALRLDAEARRRYGVPSVGVPVRPNPWTGYGGARPPYRDYWYDRYYDRPYYDRPYYDRPYPREYVEDAGPVDVGPRRTRVARDAGANVGAANDAAQDAAAARVPDLPPDELLGDEEMSPALRQALANSPEWKQSTAELVRAWTDYAEAVEAVLGDLRDRPEYRRARAALRRATATLQAVQAEDAGGGAQNAPNDRLLTATNAALAARRTVRRLETAALAADPDVQKAQRRLDGVLERRAKIRDQAAAKLPEADRPATPKRPKLLEEE